MEIVANTIKESSFMCIAEILFYSSIQQQLFYRSRWSVGDVVHMYPVCIWLDYGLGY